MITYACILLSLTSFARSECTIDSTTDHIAKEATLHDDLMKNYMNSEQAARMRNTTVPVKLRFIVKTFQFYNEEEDFLLHSWAFLTWHDDCLTWNPADYDNIDNTIMHIGHIWAPQITLDNEVAYDYDIFMTPMQRCQVFSTGLIVCVPRVTHVVICNSILTNWPYDTQTCSFKYSFKNVNLSYPVSRPITMLGAEYGTGWTIVAYEYTHPDHLVDKMVISLTVERTAAVLAAYNVLPLMVVAVLSLAALLIDVRSTVRVHILCFCLACDFVFVQAINENIPLAGVGTPKIMLFLRNSILMSAISIVVTFSLKNIRKRKNPSPTWMIQINEFMLKDSRKMLVWPKWETECCEDDSINKALEDWNSFSYILNFFQLITYFIIYLIFFLIYIPKPIPVTM